MSEDKSGRSLPGFEVVEEKSCIQLARSGLDGYFQGDYERDEALMRLSVSR